jgi:D-alanine-D-alanine ligase
LNVGLVFGGRSTEHLVSVVSARTVAAALEAAGHRVVPLGVGEDGSWRPVEEGWDALEGRRDVLPSRGGRTPRSLGPLLDLEIDVLFPLVHGTWGEDGTLQGLCEMLDLPYAGAGVTASAVAMDKHLCKTVLDRAGVPVVEWEVVDEDGLAAFDADAVLPGFEPPFFVKPAVGGSSVGVERVRDRAELSAAVQRALAFDDQVLIERGVVGRELECSVLGYRQLEASRVGEIVPGREFYDYFDKYIDNTADLRLPAELEPELEERLRRTAIDAFAAVGGHGMARVDFLLEETGAVFVNEINTLPGFTSISMYPKLWEISGLPIEQLVDRLIRIALDCHADRHRLDQGIKTWLRSLDA